LPTRFNRDACISARSTLLLRLQRLLQRLSVLYGHERGCIYPQTRCPMELSTYTGKRQRAPKTLSIYSMAHGLDPHTVDAIITYLRADKLHCASQFLPRADARKPRLPTLPPEVIDMVIDFLHSDKRSLAACSLTCKMWLSSSRFHLFSKVLLSTKNRISSFAALFEKSFNSVAPFVQHLIISLRPRGYHTYWTTGKRVEIAIVCDFACHCYSTTLYYY
jgi:hypothetical protein